MRLNSAKDLDVYKKAYTLAMEIFEVSKIFPCLTLQKIVNTYQANNTKS